MLMLHVCGATKVWADDISVIFDSGISNGTITPSINQSTRVVTLTVSPDDGFRTRKSLIKVEKMVSPSRSSRRRAPGIGTFDITGGPDGDDWIYNSSTDNTFTFTVPAEYDGAYVTATFVSTSSSSGIPITSLDQITDLTASYFLARDIDASGFSSSLGEFSGTLDGDLHKITNLGVPLFSTLNGGTVKNLTLEDVSISSGNAAGDAGAICCEATGASRIYNCGILATTTTRNTDGTVSFSGSSVSGTHYVGSFVGLLDGSSRVINCYSYANISGGTECAGIVGYNNHASTHSDIQTMVMNCLFYGDVSGGTVAPIYGGLEINNESTSQLNNYNYFLYEAPFSKNNYTGHILINKYNHALAAEERYLVRWEFYRNLVNSTRELAAYYVGATLADLSTGEKRYDRDEMLKWVLDKSIAPYPILKVQGTYPSPVNYDPEYTNDATGAKVSRNSVTEHNKGGIITSMGTGGELSITISTSKTTGGQTWPTGATIHTTSLSRSITDKDENNYNYNYGKVQLPYYNEVGYGNYTGNKVVTGWKITSITAVDGDPYTAANYTGDNYDSPNYNFADRKSSNKDLYTISGRVFSQGAYFDVPDGVTSITIEPYWGNAAYLSDATYDCYYLPGRTDVANNIKHRYEISGVTEFGTRYTNGSNYSINGDDQPVYTSFANALSSLSRGDDTSIYDNAVVLVGNYHQKGSPENNSKQDFTVMSADLNFDNEPDYSLIMHSGKQEEFPPIRFDFINVPGAAMAHKMTSTTYMGIIGNIKPKGWFETTNTATIRFSQYEYDSELKKENAPFIFLGGIIDMFTSTNGTEGSTKNTKYIHVGSNAYFQVFNNGCHMDKTKTSTPHRPISVTGGEYDKFYLSGYLQAAAPAYTTNDGGKNAECYVSGGKFGEMAGAGYEQIAGDVTWQIYNADIDAFYGGGINHNKPVQGDITTTIRDSHVTQFCGGPKFGNMASGKTVTTTASGCTFGNYFGAGYGGTALTRVNVYNKFNTLTYNWNGTSENLAITPQFTNPSGANHRGLYKEGQGIAINYDYRNFEGSTINTVGYLFVNYASLSLAQTNNVTSTLTGCTIDENFYGGGRLGEVKGDATSSLTGCTVKGNVFGAGYSASVPTADVFPAEGFKTPIPFYNSQTGVFEPGGGYPTAVEYIWSNDKGSNSNTLVDEGGKHYIHVDKSEVDLTQLGTVTGTVTLDINDGTNIGGNVDGGNVYGGGALSDATGDVEVNINGGTVTKDVYGGGMGKTTVVGGHVTVNIGSKDESTSPATYAGNASVRDVYGGSALGNTNVTKDNDWTEANPKLTATAGKVTKVNLYQGTVNRNVYGGGLGDNTSGAEIASNVYGSVTVTAEHQANALNVFGCNNLYGAPQSTVAVLISSTAAVTSAKPDPIGNVYGGGNLAAAGTAEHPLTPTVTMTGGTVGYIYGGGLGAPATLTGNTSVTLVDGTVNKDIYGGGNEANVTGNVEVKIQGGEVKQDVYGGGALANTNTASTTTVVEGVSKTTYPNTKVSLTGGSIRDVYGGGLGRKASGSESAVAATSGNVLVELNNNNPGGDVDGSKRGCVVNQIFGANNANGTPLGTDTVHVYATQHRNLATLSNNYEPPYATTKYSSEGYKDYLQRLIDAAKPGGTALTGIDATKVTAAEDVLDGLSSTEEKDLTDPQIASITTAANNLQAEFKKLYDVQAVYGGGNEAEYKPTDTKGTTTVIIDGCSLTNIESVYGGGNAAAAPATDVTLNSAHAINYLFGGGNGVVSPANVGYSGEAYTGKAVTKLIGGKVYHVYGGSNTQGDVMGGTSLSMPSTNDECPLVVKQIYGAGQNAEQTGGVEMVIANCTNDLDRVVYGGAKDANVAGGVNLIIIGGHFKQVFGGNDTSGTIQGPITVTIEEEGCKPVTIDELYLGGNQAAYSVYGYWKDASDGNKLKPRTSADDAHMPVKPDGTEYTQLSDFTNYRDPILDVFSCTSIGKVYGGGLGAGALMYGNPAVNLNMFPGHYAKDIDRDGTPGEDNNENALGEIGQVFGGGSLANVIGNTKVNICTEKLVTTRYANSETPVKGAYIMGNVYGGGDEADVIGDTQVNICAKYDDTADAYIPVEETRASDRTVIIGQETPTATSGNVFGAGKGKDGEPLTALVHGNSTVYMGGGTVTGSVYGGGELSSVGTVTNWDDLETTYKHTSKTGETFYDFGLSWPYEFVYSKDASDEYDTGLATVVLMGTAHVVTNAANGGYVFGAGKGKVAVDGTYDISTQRYFEAKYANVRATQVIIGRPGTNDDAPIVRTVYGGGEDGHVYQDASITINKGTVQRTVFGGGKGTSTYSTKLLDPASEGNPKATAEDVHSWTAGRVFGNTNVTMNGGAVGWYIYGGGNMASVGKGSYAGGSDDYSINGYGELPPSASPSLWTNTDFTESGIAKVNIYGGEVGKVVVDGDAPTGLPRGSVFGGSRGVAAADCSFSPRYKYVPDFFLGYVNKAIVTIGDDEHEAPKIYGSVYGGGENGHIRNSASVTIEKGEIGTESSSDPDCGNVFGAGSGVGTYMDGSQPKCNNASGSVTCTTTVQINGGTINRNVYGGGALASVGPPRIGTFDEYKSTDTDYDEASPRAHGSQSYTQVNVNGGTVKGSVFGASRGPSDALITDVFTISSVNTYDATRFATVLWADVNITGAASIAGNVYGGGEKGVVKDATLVNIGTTGTGGLTYTGTISGNVFGGGQKANVHGDVTVNVNSGTVTNDVYGGGALAHTNTDNWDDSQYVVYPTTNGVSLVTGLYTESGGTYTEITEPNTRAAASTTYYQKGKWATDMNVGNKTTYTTTVNLKGGIVGNAYGGGLGQMKVEAAAAQAATYYTAPEATAYNATLVGALNSTTPLTADQADAYNAAMAPATKAAGNTLSDEEAAAYNAKLSGAVKEGDLKSPALAAVTAVEGIEANVYGDVAVTVNGTAFTHSFVTPTDADGNEIPNALDVPTTGRVFGCNNLNGTPMGNVVVEVDRTRRITDTGEVSDDHQENVFEIHSVYGGGNLATYQPATGKSPKVIIKGCDDTSIEKVFGGGNSASVPSTDVLILGTFYVGYAFSGGNGADMFQKGGNWVMNDGAPIYGDALIKAIGGKIGQVFGGSDTKGNVYGSTTTLLKGKGYTPLSSETSDCDLQITNAYGAARGADIEGDVNFIVSGCSGNEIERVFGGSYDANIRGSVTLTITSGIFAQVFGGNDHGGTIGGEINVNIEETDDCNPVIIQYLYGGGREAEYPGTGAKYITNPKDSNGDYIGELNFANFPNSAAGKNAKITINVKSATRIDNIYGGCYRAKVNGDTEVNINMMQGNWGTGEKTISFPDTYRGDQIPNVHNYNVSYKEVTGLRTADPSTGDLGSLIVGLYQCDDESANPKTYTKITDQTARYTGGTYYRLWMNGIVNAGIGTIGNVFGGCFEGALVGNTKINIGTETQVKILKRDETTKAIVDAEGHEIYLNGKLIKGKTVAYVDKPVVGVHITGNVYGGGERADITRNTDVNIGAKDSGSGYAAVAQGTSGVTIEGNVFGGGMGIADNFYCDKAMIGINNTNTGTDNAAHANDGTHVRIGNGTVEGTVYGGGEIGRVEYNSTVTIGYGNGSDNTSAPEIKGSVFGAGKGVNTHGYSALVRGNSTVVVQGRAKVGTGTTGGSIYGGGEMASVGKYQVNAVTGLPEALYTQDLGHCFVTVQGKAEVGPDNMEMPTFAGHVFGAGKGALPYEGYADDKQPYQVLPTTTVYYQSKTASGGEEDAYMTFIESLALATKTEVTISGDAFIKGSVYGGSELGHVQSDTYVKIAGGQIGNGYIQMNDDGTYLNRLSSPVDHVAVNRPYTADEWAANHLIPNSTTDASWYSTVNGNYYTSSLPECSSWPYGQMDGVQKYAPYDPYTNLHGDDGHTFYGNVFGGGCGVKPYMEGKWHYAGGSVGGSTKVEITGGHILTSIYGGNELTNVTGDSCVVIMTGGTLGVPRTLDQIKYHPVTCYLFGAGKGDQRNIFNSWTNVKNTRVYVGGTSKIYGSVFGGGEDGHVYGDAKVQIYNGTIGTWGTSYVDGNIFGGGRGYAGEALTAGAVCGDTYVDIGGGTMLGSVYGGGRLASVGIYLAPATGAGSDNYGKLIPDGTTVNGVSSHGHITVNITGGTIGNNYEYRYLKPTTTNTPSGLVVADVNSWSDENWETWKAHNNIPNTLIEYSSSRGYAMLNHPKGGNVFAGCMGRREKQGSTTEAIPNWTKLGIALTTKVTVSGNSTWIKGSVYGGGEYGAVLGTHTTTTDSKTVGTEVLIDGGTIGTVMGSDVNNGTYDTGIGTGDFRYSFGNVWGGGYGTEKGVDYIETDVEKFGAWIENDTYVKMNAGKVRGSVYGGGKLAAVKRNTNVSVSGGEIGVGDLKSNDYVLFGNWRMGNVFGGGKGSTNAVSSGLVKGNTYVSITPGSESGEPKIYHNVYGGGALSSVGTYTIQQTDASLVKKGAPTACADGTGTATVTITGGTIGINGYDNGMVNGSGRGDISSNKPSGHFDPYDNQAWVNNTVVTIGTAGDGFSQPLIMGTAYGGGENGHNLGNASITIHSGTIGTSATSSWENGNVMGAGCGTDTYEDVSTPAVKYYNPMSGRVRGNTTVTIDGGHVLRNVYGGGSMASTDGTTSVTISGGRIGTYDAGTGKYYLGNVYGGPKGSLLIDPAEDHAEAHVGGTTVNINYGTTPTEDKSTYDEELICGSVYGGGEAGIVYGNVAVKMLGGLVLNNVYGGGALADTNTKNWDESANTGKYVEEFGLVPDKSKATGFYTYDGTNYTKITSDITAVAGTRYYKPEGTWASDGYNADTKKTKYNTTVSLTGGIVNHEAYGGALGRRQVKDFGETGFVAPISPNVYGDILVELNNNNNGSEADGTKKGCIVERVFGSNDLQGTPKGHVKVHVYATQSRLAGKTTIANKVGEGGYDLTEVTDVDRLKGYLTDKITWAGAIGVTTTSYEAVASSSTATADEVKTALTAINADIQDAADTHLDVYKSYYDVLAVYGGGDLAPYDPANANDSTEVIIDGCHLSSIYQAYGGSNAAATPATSITVNGAHEIFELFGGGNGKDNYMVQEGDDEVWYENPGANVGYRDYNHYLTKDETGYSATANGAGTEVSPYKALDNSDALTADNRKKNYLYGTGRASTVVIGGLIHRAYGGSNVKGNIRATALSRYESSIDDCKLKVDETYGGSKDAPLDGTIELTLDCVKDMDVIFGGSKNADVNANIKLNITNGTFKQVFGGNNTSGAISGSITVNIEEKGCQPIFIEELYGGGYLAPYSIWGYKSNGRGGYATETKTYAGIGEVKQRIPMTKKEFTDSISIFNGWIRNDLDHLFSTSYVVNDNTDNDVATKLAANPTDATISRYASEYFAIKERINSHPKKDLIIRVISATRIDNIYGGGYQAKVVCDPRVNVNMTEGMIPEKFMTPIPGPFSHTMNGKTYSCSVSMAENGKDGSLPLGSIGNVFGGGNMADISGNTYVEIGTGQWVNDDEMWEMVEDTYHNTYTLDNKTDDQHTWREYAAAVAADNTTNWKWYDTSGNEATSELLPLKPHRNEAVITGNVYGGGRMGHVGEFELDDDDTNDIPDGKPISCAEGTGQTHVIVSNGSIGPDNMQMFHLDANHKIVDNDHPDDAGHVYGGGQGTQDYFYDDNTDMTEAAKLAGMLALGATEEEIDAKMNTKVAILAFVDSTDVTVNGTAFVRGCVFGGAENGHVLHNTGVKIGGDCQIGSGHILLYDDGGNITANTGLNRRYTDDEWKNSHFIQQPNDPVNWPSESLPECASWLYGKEIDESGSTGIVKAHEHHQPYDKYADLYSPEGGTKIASSGRTFNGNVFGGGSGFFPFAPGHWLETSGEVEGHTWVEVTGGHILTSLYGGNEMSSVLGDTHIIMKGGTVGVPRTLDEIMGHPVTCYVFGGGKGEARSYLNHDTNVGNAYVDIQGGWVYGSVFGGAEDGHVKGNTFVTISEPTTASAIAEPTYEDYYKGRATKIGTWGTSYVDGNIFGGGRGFDGHNVEAGNVMGNTTINFTGGLMLGSIYGGGRLASVGHDYSKPESPQNGYFQDDDATAATHNAGLTGALNSTDALTSEQATAYNTARGFTSSDAGYRSAGNTLSADEAAAYNATLPGAVTADDVHTGRTTVNVSGGTIGNKWEENITAPDGFKDMSEAERKTWLMAHNIPNTRFDENTGKVKFSMGGKVYGGSMGRLTTLSGHVLTNWPKTAQVKNTYVNITGGNIKRDVLGGGEMGTVKQDAHVNISGGSIRYDVYGGSYGSDINTEDYQAVTEIDIPGSSPMYFVYTPLMFAGCVGGDTYVDISDGKIGNNVYGGGEMASVGVIDFEATRTQTGTDPGGDPIYKYEYKNNRQHYHDSDDRNKSFVLSWPWEINYTTLIKGGTTNVNITGGRIGTADSDIVGYDNGNVYGGGQGLVGDLYDFAFCANNKYSNVTINYASVPSDVTDPAAALITGSVFGGAENGHVIEDTHVFMKNGYVSHSLFGGGRGQDTYLRKLLKVTDPNGATFTDEEIPIHDISAGKVYGNTYLTMTGGKVGNNVLGGGYMASVGKGNYASGSDDYFPTGYGETLNGATNAADRTLWDGNNANSRAFLNSGKTTLNILGGEIGSTKLWDNLPAGNIFGGCRGLAAPEITNDPRVYYCPDFYIGYVNETEVNIGGYQCKTAYGDYQVGDIIEAKDYNLMSDGDKAKWEATVPRIWGSVYGGAQDGHVRRDAHVIMNSGEIGVPYIDTYQTSFGTDLDNVQWLLRGNVFGAGSGLSKYTFDYDYDGKTFEDTNHNGVLDAGEAIHTADYNGDEVNEIDYSTSAGSVTRFTTIDIKGGIIHRNVYGGGSLASVGAPRIDQDYDPYKRDDSNTATKGKQSTNTVNISGGTVGTPDGYIEGFKFNSIYGGEVYGASRGMKTLDQNKFATSTWTQVNILKGAIIMNNVFGGGDAGIVKRDSEVNIGEKKKPATTP